MKTKQKILLSFMCLIGLTAHAGGSTGGGNVVVCKDSTTGKETIQLLDYYEGELLYELNPDLGTGATELEMVKHVTDRLAKYDKARAEKYEKSAKAFLGNTRFVTKVTLPSINDSAYVPLEAHCRIEQIAVQNISPFPQSKKFTIRKDYWTKLALQDRAGLMLHEIIYEEALGLGHTNSKSARYLNALVSSESFAKYSGSDYQARLELIGFEKPTGASKEEEYAFGWLKNPITLANTEANKLFMINLNNFIASYEAGTETFQIIRGPSWLSISRNGALRGTPSDADVGNFDLEVEVSNQDKRAAATLSGKVVKSKTVVKIVEEVSMTAGRTDMFAWTSALPKDLAGYSYETKNRPAFMDAAAPGTVTGSPTGPMQGVLSTAHPQESDIGTYTLQLIAETESKIYRVYYILNVTKEAL